MPRRRLRPRELPESTQPGRETSWGWGWGSKPGQMAPVSFCSDSALHLVTGCTQRLEGLTLHPHKQPPSANNWALFEKGPQHLSEPFFFFLFARVRPAIDRSPLGEERAEWPGLGGTEDQSVRTPRVRRVRVPRPRPRGARAASGPGGAGGREEGPAAGARHKVFQNTAGRPAKFAAGLTRKRR